MILVYMADPTGTPEAAKEAPRPEQTGRLLGVAGRALHGEHKRRFGEEGQERKPAPGAEAALRTHFQLLHGINITNQDLPSSADPAQQYRVPADRAGGNPDEMITLKRIVRTVERKNADGTSSYAYECEATNADGTPANGGRPIELSRSDVADAHLAVEGDTIATLFDTQGQTVIRAALKALPQRGTGLTVGDLPSDATLAAVEATYPLPAPEAAEAEKPLTPQQQRIADEIARIRGKEENVEKLSKKEQELLGKLESAHALRDGPMGDFMTYQALLAIQQALPEHWIRKGWRPGKELKPDQQAEMGRLQDLIYDRDFNKSAMVQQQDLLGAIEEGGVDPGLFAKWKEKITDETKGGMFDLLDNKKFLGFLAEGRGAETNKMLFGRLISKTELADLQKLAETDDKTGFWRGLLKVLWITTKVAAGVAVAAPAAVVVGGYQVAATTGRGGGGA